ncbi:MAG: hypothetical protein ACI85U_000161, partial [Candidatus Promineifilaceae bacterium]
MTNDQFATYWSLITDYYPLKKMADLTITTDQDYSPGREAWRMFLTNKAAVFGLILFVLVLL